ncbi:MAG: hypothetical protein P4L20_08820 [Acidimicrobiales bacterium]|nr:hypothetical protein [Acidimicrobiales bacterium]
MSDIDDWLRAHEEELADIARGTDLESPLVHLAAVLVLAGFEDTQIYDQLHALVVSLDGQRHPLAGAPRALEEIRLLASAHP